MRIQRVARLLALLALLTMILTACAEEPVDVGVAEVGESGVIVESDGDDADEVEEPSVEEAVEARAEDYPSVETDKTVEPLGEPLVEEIEEQIEEQIETLGEEVSVSGTVNEILGDRLFTFTPSQSDPLLVIVVNDEAAPSGFAAASPVTLTGAVVAAFFVEDIEKETGLDLDDDLLGDYEGGPAFIATSVEGSD